MEDMFILLFLDEEACDRIGFTKISPVIGKNARLGISGQRIGRELILYSSPAPNPQTQNRTEYVLLETKRSFGLYLILYYDIIPPLKNLYLKSMPLSKGKFVPALVLITLEPLFPTSKTQSTRPFSLSGLFIWLLIES